MIVGVFDCHDPVALFALIRRHIGLNHPLVSV